MRAGSTRRGTDQLAVFGADALQERVEGPDVGEDVRRDEAGCVFAVPIADQIASPERQAEKIQRLPATPFNAVLRCLDIRLAGEVGNDGRRQRRLLVDRLQHLAVGNDQPRPDERLTREDVFDRLHPGIDADIRPEAAGNADQMLRAVGMRNVMEIEIALRRRQRCDCAPGRPPLLTGWIVSVAEKHVSAQRDFPDTATALRLPWRAACNRGTIRSRSRLFAQEANARGMEKHWVGRLD